MIYEFLNLIKDEVNESRDLAIDDLADLFDGNHLSEALKTQAILSLLKTIEKEEDSSVVESTYNLFGIAFADNICNSEIAEKCANMLNRLEPGSLVHALSIIADSNLANKKALIYNYLNSTNPAVEKIAKESLQHMI
jgi:hypothetical protein